jgi:hypothetical protein
VYMNFILLNKFIDIKIDIFMAKMRSW